MTDQDKQKIESYGKEILEQLNLEHLLNMMALEKKDQTEISYSFADFIYIMKYFVLNQKEKDYLDRILKEVEENERLEMRANELALEVQNENKKRRLKKDL